MRKLNDFIKRARQAKIHAYIIANLKDDMPKLFGKGRKKKELIKNLPALLKKIQEDHLVANSDLPELSKLQEKLNQADFQKFPQMKVSFKAISFVKSFFQDKLIAQVNHMLDVDISELMGIVPPSDTDPVIRGGAFDDVKDQVSPFGFEKCEGDPFLSLQRANAPFCRSPTALPALAPTEPLNVDEMKGMQAARGERVGGNCED